jgi:hypothetical protein
MISATFFGIFGDAFQPSSLGSGVGELGFVMVGTAVAAATGVAEGEANGSVEFAEGELFAFCGFPEQAEKLKRNTISEMHFNFTVSLDLQGTEE